MLRKWKHGNMIDKGENDTSAGRQGKGQGSK